MTLTIVGALTLPALAQSIEYEAELAGASEVPAVTSPARGSASVMIEPQFRILTWVITFSGLSGPATAAHFHGPAGAGANAPPIVSIPDRNLRSPIIGMATLSAAQAADLEQGCIYLNIHTAAHPAGEIRGQVVKQK
jgi:hypothetical protein